MRRSASTQWRGNLKQGIGFISSESGKLLNIPYSYTKRFENDPGINPEELIAAAYSACFAMAMSAELDKKNLHAENIDVNVIVSLDQTEEEWRIPDIHIIVSAFVPKASKTDVKLAAETAKLNCPVSKLLRANITMEFSIGDYKTSSIHI